jgi:hypothetical protein
MEPEVEREDDTVKDEALDSTVNAKSSKRSLGTVGELCVPSLLPCPHRWR